MEVVVRKMKKRDYETHENNERNEKERSAKPFRLFRYFRVFRNLLLEQSQKFLLRRGIDLREREVFFDVRDLAHPNQSRCDSRR